MKNLHTKVLIYPPTPSIFMAEHAPSMSMYDIHALSLLYSVLESPFSWTPSSLSPSHVESVGPLPLRSPLSPFPPSDGRNYCAVTK